jgi:hypothetical protein
MKIKTPCIAVYVGGASDYHTLRYGVEVNTVEYFSRLKAYEVERDGVFYSASENELYFPHLNTYNQKCFN